MFAHAIDTYPVGVLLALSIVGIVIVVVAVRGLLELFIEYADCEADAPPHSFNPLHPSHCDRCWNEAKQRQSEARLRKDLPPLYVHDREVRR